LALLAYAQTKGRFVVALRNRNDVFTEDMPEITEENMFSFRQKPSQKAIAEIQKSKRMPISKEDASGES